jgi:hypothetical protein
LDALTEMAKYYGEAHQRDKELAAKKDEKPDPYPFTNWAVGRVLVLQLDVSQGGEWQKTLSEEVTGMIEIAKARNARKPNFWDSAAEADCELVLLMAQTKLTGKQARETAERIIELYRAAFKRGASPRQIASVREHLDFVIDLYGSAPKPLHDALAAIRAAI